MLFGIRDDLDFLDKSISSEVVPKFGATRRILSNLGLVESLPNLLGGETQIILGAKERIYSPKERLLNPSADGEEVFLLLQFVCFLVLCDLAAILTEFLKL